MPSSIPMDSSILPFDTKHVSKVLPVSPQNRWLIEPLWFKSGVGILGGHAKVCKTQLAAEIAIAVASGNKALGRLPVSSPGPVLFYGAEDALPMLRARFEDLANARNLSLDSIPLFLLDVPLLSLDRTEHLQRLRAALNQLQPRLLILDPLVRIARLDENSAADVSLLLGSLRAIQRDFDLALLLVHHARKSRAQNPGQALRGSSDISAWSDTNLYLSRKDHLLTLQVEHRFAAPPTPIQLKLSSEPAIHLDIINYDSTDSIDTNPHSLDPLQLQLLNLLSTRRPLTTVALRSLLHRRKQHVVLALNHLLQLNLIQRGPDGWSLSS
ncbi:MAG: AAA family ATPase [Anaerolineales bacterium]|jgi:hypothetical protein